MSQALTQILNPKKQLAGWLLLALAVQLVIGGALLPYREAKAVGGVGDVVTDPGLTWQTVAGWMKSGWQAAAAAAQRAQQIASGWVTAASTLWQQQNAVLQKLVQFAWNRLRRILLNMLVNDIINWVNGGGKPRFVQDWGKFLQTAADKAIGSVIDDKLGGMLCKPFSLQLRIALARVPTFEEEVSCSLSDVISNINNFFTDFNQGGWTAWLSVTETENNVYGAYLMTLNRQYEVASKAREASKSEAEASAGFLGDKICRQLRDKQTGALSTSVDGVQGMKENEIPAGYECAKWDIRTPGRIVGDSLQQATGIDIPWLISAKEFAEYAGAIVDAVINRAIREGVAYMSSSSDGLSSGSSGAGITTPATVSVSMPAYQEAIQSMTSVESISNNARLFKENIDTVLKEYQTNLGILQQTERSIINSFSMVSQTNAGGMVISDSTGVEGNCDKVCPCTQTRTRNQAISISGLASGILKTVTTERLMFGSDMYGFTGCLMVTSSTSTRSVENLSTTSGNEMKTVQTEMQALQAKKSFVDQAVKDVTDYKTAASKYMMLFESAQSQTASSTELTAAETAMLDAKKKAIASLQGLTGSNADTFEALSSELQQQALDVAQKPGDLQMRRGLSSDCNFADAGTYYADLCAAKAKENELKINGAGDFTPISGG